MRPEGASGELFAAFSRITASAFVGDRLLSCPTLSKAPNYGDVQRLYLTQAPHATPRGWHLVAMALRYWLNNIAHLLFLVTARIFIFALRWKIPTELHAAQAQNTARQLIIIDSFAVLPRLAQRSSFEELYLPGLFEEAQNAGYACARLYRLYGSRNPVILWKTLRTLAAHGNGFTEIHLLTGMDWLLLCRHMLTYPLALYRLIRSLTHYTPLLPEAYIRTALINTMGQCILHGETRRLAALRLGHMLAKLPCTNSAHTPCADTAKSPCPADTSPKIISWYENQTINKTFQRGLAQAEQQTKRHVRVIGTQLFTWPANLLNNHPDDGEAALSLAPDVVAVNGPYFLPENSRQTYTVGPAVRYKEIFAPSTMPSATPSPPSPNATATADADATADATATASCPTPPTISNKPILALLSYHPEETRRVLELVLPLASGKTRVAYKFHPATQPTAFSAWLPPSPEILTQNLSTVLQKAAAVIGSGSGSLLEAAAIGIPTLAVETPGPAGLGLNYLPKDSPDCGKGTLWASVQSPDEVEPALAQLYAQRDNATEHARTVQAFRALVFTEPTVERLRALLAL